MRANHLDMDELAASVITRYPQLDDEQRAELTDWYANLVEMMHHDGVETAGHLQINRNVVTEMCDLHERLMHSTKFPFYQAAYYKILPAIVELRAKSPQTAKSEIETCFDALYGVWMLKLQRRPINPETAEAMQNISTFIGMLSDYFLKDNKGELIFE